MSPTIRFHLDENVPSAVAEGLRRRGFDVTTTSQVGMLGASDEEQLEFAASESRVFVSCDANFLRLHDRGMPHAGIAYSPKGQRTIGELIHGLIMIAECLPPDEMRNHVEYL